MKSLVDVMFPNTEAVPVDVDAMELPRAFDEFLANEPAHNVADLRRALVLVEFGPLIFERRPTTFSRLEPDERLAHWNSWASSDRLIQRQVSIAMRKFFNLVYFDQPSVWPYIGYPGPSLARAKGVTP